MKLEYLNLEYLRLNRGRISSFGMFKLYVWSLIVLISLPTMTQAVDGCSISGANNVCCENTGVGPYCSQCTS